MGNYRKCETCGNAKCKNQFPVAAMYDACLKDNYKFWQSKYVWLRTQNETEEDVDSICQQMDKLLEIAERKKGVKAVESE